MMRLAAGERAYKYVEFSLKQQTAPPPKGVESSQDCRHPSMYTILCYAGMPYAHPPLHPPLNDCVQAVFRSILATSAGRPELTARLAAGLLLVGPGGGLRGLGPMLERRVAQRLTAAGQAQVCAGE